MGWRRLPLAVVPDVIAVTSTMCPGAAGSGHG
uniref:Uncharacterized protein n=1 Tax=Setaria viridis TaxID=4556 RepID=A0A4U6VBX4_SETVI|nr:hypothetical protein SEVIR_3G041840v2 [Setaria viridis]TKW24619.1 hypothetical protein SEVIR_3G061099v2 [Setaria viridis]